MKAVTVMLAYLLTAHALPYDSIVHIYSGYQTSDDTPSPTIDHGKYVYGASSHGYGALNYGTSGYGTFSYGAYGYAALNYGTYGYATYSYGTRRYGASSYGAYINLLFDK